MLQTEITATKQVTQEMVDAAYADLKKSTELSDDVLLGVIAGVFRNMFPDEPLPPELVDREFQPQAPAR